MTLFAWSEDRFLRYATAFFLVLWIACVGPVRTWATDVGIRSWWIFGVAPSLFAGITFATWQAVATRVSAWTAFAFGIA
ncbi:MAG: hypothetical protein AAF730_08235 [Bacteroidota bacterium]